MRFMWHPETVGFAFATWKGKRSRSQLMNVKQRESVRALQKQLGCSTLKSLNQERYKVPPAAGRPLTGRSERVCYRNRSPQGAAESEGGFLAGRTSNSGLNATNKKIKQTARAVEREYVPIEDDPTVGRNAPEGAADAPANDSAKPSMREAFGPGGFLEKCMLAGFDPHRVRGHMGYQYRPAQLEMAELGHGSFQAPQHAIVEAGARHAPKPAHPRIG